MFLLNKTWQHVIICSSTYVQWRHWCHVTHTTHTLALQKRIRHPQKEIPGDVNVKQTATDGMIFPKRHFTLEVFWQRRGGWSFVQAAAGIRRQSSRQTLKKNFGRATTRREEFFFLKKPLPFSTFLFATNNALTSVKQVTWSDAVTCRSNGQSGRRRQFWKNKGKHVGWHSICLLLRKWNQIVKALHYSRVRHLMANVYIKSTQI